MDSQHILNMSTNQSKNYIYGMLEYSDDFERYSKMAIRIDSNDPEILSRNDHSGEVYLNYSREILFSIFYSKNLK